MLPSRPARAPVAVLLAALALATVLAGPAARAEGAPNREVSGGRLDWGIKASFQSYVTGPIAQGSWDLQGGAATVGESRFRFHTAKGTYAPDSGTFEAGFSGGVHFTGHRKPDGTHELDLTVSRPAVRISGDRGTLYADVTSKAVTAAHVPLAALDLSGTHLRGGGTAVSLTDVPARLTAEGAKAFAGYYGEGTALDPVSFSADIAEKGASSPSSAPSEKPAEKGEFTGAAVDWGVRRTFREYVTGPVAQGSWTPADGAQDGGALFRFPHGKGTYTAGGTALDAAFAGTLRFTGKNLDLALSAVRVTVKAGKGTLAAGGRPLVTFDATGLKQKDGLAVLTEAPAKLTAEGAGVFGGMYREGTDMDPVSLAVPLVTGAPLPPLPDLGSAPSAPSPSPSPFPVLPVAAAGAGVLALTAVTFAVLRRRKSTTDQGDNRP
ncbi:HtaA domain-containing protein [Streptoverticillium reticulum]|uniref:HtaA domain-containing protein n=1 Tax=Streptoverticillium reticulum TaxID=1433415 RepID=UPI0039BF8311